MNVKLAVVVTSANQTQADAVQRELEHRRDLGALPRDAIVLAVPDPSGERIGSGGATLNALVAVAAEKAGERAVDVKAFLAETLILCIHSGGDSQRSPIQSVCGSEL